MRITVAAAAGFLVTLAVPSIVESQEKTPPAAEASKRPLRGSLNHIPNGEIEAAGVDLINAYDLVSRLRPSMLRMRNQTAGDASGSIMGPVAYIDDIRLGDPELLRTVMRATVREIRYISATDATTRWGTGHSNGVVQVFTKR